MTEQPYSPKGQGPKCPKCGTVVSEHQYPQKGGEVKRILKCESLSGCGWQRVLE